MTSEISAAPTTNLGELQIAVVYRKIEELKPDPTNPRRRSAQVQRRIRESIRANGFVIPVIVDAESRIVIGQARTDAARAEGLTEVPTIPLHHLTPAQAKTLQLLDNRLVELGTWDDQMLGEVLRDLSLQDDALGKYDTGFDAGEIDRFISALDQPIVEEDEPTLADEGLSVSRLGDLWSLGNHRVLCGDALQEASHHQLMDGAKADMAFLDNPYNVPIDGHVGGSGAIKHREFAMGVGEMDDGEFRSFLKTGFIRVAESIRDGAVVYACMDWRHIEELIAAGKAVFDRHLNICVWVKNAPGLGSFYRSHHEMIAVFRKGKKTHRNNVQLGKYGRARSNVWNYAGMTGFGRHTDEGNLLEIHPTVKPVPMIADAILDATARGDIVIDPFLGSGSTLIAAQRVGRRCYGIELDPIYVDTAIRRWQRITGDTARHIETGRTFCEIEAEGWK